ncbi:MAG: insulinase family protein [bacterium]|nr:insulinase family protein [bacterium]
MKHTVTEVQFKNGLRGLLIDVPDADVMYTEVNFRAGEYLLQKEKWETAHLMEHVLLGANRRYPKARDFQAEIEKNGAYCNASTGVYDITYESECADFEWERVLELLLVAIAEPLFLQEEFDSEAGNVREELVGRSNNHFRHLNISLRENMGMVAMTDQKRLDYMKEVSLHDVSKHYKSTHNLANARFILSGKLSGRVKLIEEMFSKFLALPKGESRKMLPTESPKRLKSPLLIRRSHVPNMYFYIDTYAKQVVDGKNRDALLVASTLLTETLYSRIFGLAREKGLVYAMGSGQTPQTNVHSWWLGAQVSLTNAPALFRLIRDELKAVKEGGLNKFEIEAAEQYLIGKYQRSGQTVSGIVAGYSPAYYLEEQIEDFTRFAERMQAVTPDDVTIVFNRMFSDNTWGLAALGNAKLQFIRELAATLEELWPAKTRRR